MNKSNVACSILSVVFTLSAHAQADPPLRRVHTTLLPGYVGDFEHFAVDVKGNRLFLVAEDHKTVEVLDPRTGERIHTITGFGQPHAIVYLPDTERPIVTDGNDDFGAAELVSGTDYKILDKIRLPSGVDGAVYNPVNKYYYVESHGDEPGEKTHVLNIIDTQTFKHIADISLPGSHFEAMAIDRPDLLCGSSRGAWRLGAR
jgi:DNA-binding beta-propeller fold protein YncE